MRVTGRGAPGALVLLAALAIGGACAADDVPMRVPVVKAPAPRAHVAPLGIPACDSTDTPAGIVCRFYRSYLAMKPFGLPTPTERKTLDPMMSQRLRRALDLAGTTQMDYIRRHPGDKPPFVDGSLFTSLFEGARGFEIASVHADPDTGTIVTVRFEYDAATRWLDRVLVKRERERLVVEDVLFSGAGAFNPPGRLTERLRQREP